MDSNIKFISRTVALILAAFAVQPICVHATGSLHPGAVNILVLDVQGQPVSNALVYISQGSKREVLESGEKGTASVELKEGSYSVSASMTQASEDYVERLASPEAHVMVHSQDTTSIILTLHPVRDEDLTLSTLKKLGIAEEVSKYTNN